MKISQNKRIWTDTHKNISTNTGNLTIGGNEKTIDGMSVQRVENLIEKLDKERTWYILKKHI